METTQEIYRHEGADNEPSAATLALVVPTGGSVILAFAEPGTNDWVESDVFTAGGVFPIVSTIFDIRLTPAGGALYAFRRFPV